MMVGQVLEMLCPEQSKAMVYKDCHDPCMISNFDMNWSAHKTAVWALCMRCTWECTPSGFAHLQQYDSVQVHCSSLCYCCMPQMLWTFARFGYQDETLMDMMHDIAVKLQANCDSKTLAEVVYAMAQLGWADIRLHNLIADYAMDNVQVQDMQGCMACSGNSAYQSNETVSTCQSTSCHSVAWFVHLWPSVLPSTSFATTCAPPTPAGL